MVGGHALWVFTPVGHEDVRLLNGERDLWISESRDITLDRLSGGHRRGQADPGVQGHVLAGVGERTLVDLHPPQEYTGEPTHMPDYSEPGAPPWACVKPQLLLRVVPWNSPNVSGVPP